MSFEIFKCPKCGYTLVIDCAENIVVVAAVGGAATCPTHKIPLMHTGQRVARYEFYERQ